MNAPESEIQWFLARDGKQHGPVTDAEMAKLVELRHLKPTDLVWRAGFSDWRPASSVFPPLEAPAPGSQAPAAPTPADAAAAAPAPAPAPGNGAQAAAYGAASAARTNENSSRSASAICYSRRASSRQGILEADCCYDGIGAVGHRRRLACLPIPRADLARGGRFANTVV